MMAKHGEDWSEEEIAICVAAYADAHRAGGSKRELKKDLYLYRAIKQLPGRNDGAVARRMANISSVLIAHGGDPVLGWKPLDNVGPTNTLRIAKELKVAGLV